MRREADRTGSDATRWKAGPRASGLLDERELQEIERVSANGLTSREIVDVFETRGIRFSEATLRKYVQLGLLPRSVRVGRKGKHRGSCGIYPCHVVRRVNAVKGMMADNLTIEDIQRSFVKFKDDIDGVEKDLRELLSSLEREARGPTTQSPERRGELERDIVDAKRAAGELVRRITSLERRLSEREESATSAATTAGGGHDLY